MEHFCILLEGNSLLNELMRPLTAKELWKHEYRQKRLKAKGKPIVKAEIGFWTGVTIHENHQ
jgi:hypothetical protein